MQRVMQIHNTKGTALKDLCGRVMPRLIRRMWVRLGQKNGLNAHVQGWKSSNEETFLIPISELKDMYLGMDVTMYVDDTLKAITEAKSNYPMGIEKSILDTPMIKKAIPGIPILFISCTRLNYNKKASKDRLNKYYADNAGIELLSMYDGHRSQFDRRWSKGERIPPEGIIPVIERLEQIMKG